MEDSKIVGLYWERSETAISETSKKYSRYCRYISYNILHDGRDAEECVSDTYLRAWNAMPTKRPQNLSTFLGRITRNLSLDRFRQYGAEKRGFGQTQTALSELGECVPSESSVEREMDEKALIEALNSFLNGLPKQKRIIFVQRYWYLMPIKEISENSNMGESKVKSILFRERKALKAFLEEEGGII